MINIISCSKDSSVENQQYIKYQIHHHSRKGCQICNTNKCHFGFPTPPMSRTKVLEPIDFEDKDTEEYFKHLQKKIKKHIDNYGIGDYVHESFEDMLKELDMCEDEYIKAVRTSITHQKFFEEKS